MTTVRYQLQWRFPGGEWEHVTNFTTLEYVTERKEIWHASFPANEYRIVRQTATDDVLTDAELDALTETKP